MNDDTTSQYYTLFQYGCSEDYFPSLCSFDPKCLAVQAFLKFSGVPFKVENTTNNAISPDGKLPILCLGSSFTIIESELEKYILENGFTLAPDSKNVSNSNSNDIFAWSCFANDSLSKVHLYFWFYHNENYKVVKNLYTPPLTWPLNIIEMKKLRNKIIHKLDYEDVSCDSAAEFLANEVFRVLSEKLADKEFFLNNEPSRFDSIIFGYLSVFINSKLPCNHLGNMLTQYPNLTGFCRGILVKYFHSSVEIDYISAKNWIDSMNQRSIEKMNQRSSKLMDLPSSISFLVLAITTLCYVCTQDFTSILNLFGNIKFSSKKLFGFNKDPFFNENELISVDDDGNIYDWDEGFYEV